MGNWRISEAGLNHADAFISLAMNNFADVAHN